MRRAFVVCLVLLVLVIAPNAFATNGDNLIGVGPISRAMGGTGIAAPQDAISAVFSNPAGMCFGPYCPGSEVNFAGTLFMPDVEAKLDSPAFGGLIEAESDDKVYAIPAFGLSVPITNAPPLLRFGLAAYGVSGLGVDYRNTSLDPGSSGADQIFTQLQIMKFSPNIAYQPNDKLSLGLGVHIDYSALDFGNGVSFNYGIGVQIGAIYKVMDALSVGLTYVSPQEVDHQNVFDFPAPTGFPGGAGDGTLDDLKLESPQQVGVGVAFQPLGDKLLLALDYKWINWSSASGYEDFDWKDQHVIAVGVQAKPFSALPKLALRAGYNYAVNPVEEHSDFDSTATVNGMPVDGFAYEFLRTIGFPAIVQHHITGGIGYAFSNRFEVNLGGMYAIEEDFEETDSSVTNFGGAPVTLASTLSEFSVDFGLTWRY